MTPISPNNFPTTAWSMVRAAKDRENPSHAEAMNRFAAGYWRPVFYFLRTKGHPLERAEDLTQEFFLQFLDRNWIKLADPQRGRFRTYLLTVLIRFLSDQGVKRGPKQQQFDSKMVSISALLRPDDRAFEPAQHETPEEVFMNQWTRAVLGNVQNRVEAWCRERGRPDWYQVFDAIHFPPPGQRPASQEQLGKKFRQTRDQVRYAIEQVNQQFVHFLREEIAEQVDDETDIESEIRELQFCVGR